MGVPGLPLSRPEGRGSQKVKGTKLPRIIMITGDEETVEVYEAAFSSAL
ncbi:hypothetical protein [Thermococcus camini]|nr:hypothetical protein [Thermococcus camini]